MRRIRDEREVGRLVQAVVRRWGISREIHFVFGLIAE